MTVLDLIAAKRYLNITGSDHDDTLNGIIAAAEAAIAERCGPLEPTEITARVDHLGGDVALSPTPAISLTTVTPDGGSAISLTGVYVDAGSGVVTGVSAGTYTIVYQAGRVTCPPDLLLAVKELVRHLWESQRGGNKRPGSTVSDATSNTIPGAAYLFPFRVTQLIAPHIQFGFA